MEMNQDTISESKQMPVRNKNPVPVLGAGQAEVCLSLCNGKNFQQLGCITDYKIF